MALPTSGPISIKDILEEMNITADNYQIDLDTLAQYWFRRTGKSKFFDIRHKLSDWYGESWGLYYYTYYQSQAYYSGQNQARGTNFNPPIGDL
ncbi:hypothetical protein [Aquimarina agarilytica]|uniref:hypothetical protein n=1 Tax=Aquimarina agarilytica TaxID=1087449 RepID=UPI00028A0E51|nr:hypothetical protein [Aquimarina agarilytica]